METMGVPSQYQHQPAGTMPQGAAAKLLKEPLSHGHFPLRTDTLYTPLRHPFINTLWRATVYLGAAYLFLFQLPFQLALWIAPHGVVENVVWNVAYTIYEWTLPAVTLTQNVCYGLFEFVDLVLDRGVGGAVSAHRGNVQHFKVALEAYLRLIQEKAAIIERNGLRGIPMAFTARAA